MENKIEVDVPHIIKELDKEIKEYIEEGYSYAETLLQIGICWGIFILLFPPFDTISILCIVAGLSLCLGFYFKIMNIINSLK